jgi:hypothetical protein
VDETVRGICPAHARNALCQRASAADAQPCSALQERATRAATGVVLHVSHQTLHVACQPFLQCNPPAVRPARGRHLRHEAQAHYFNNSKLIRNTLII